MTLDELFERLLMNGHAAADEGRVEVGMHILRAATEVSVAIRQRDRKPTDPVVGWEDPAYDERERRLDGLVLRVEEAWAARDNQRKEVSDVGSVRG